jgi:hypothetical protein
MAELVLIDTSVLLNILDVPGKNSDRKQIEADFAVGIGRGQTFVLPVTSIIETGNHIAQLSGGDRRRCAERLVRTLEAALESNPPWVLTGAVWDQVMLGSILSGAVHRPDALTLMDQGIGTGDIGILAEVDVLRRRVPSATPIGIWTLDTVLAAYA